MKENPHISSVGLLSRSTFAKIDSNDAVEVMEVVNNDIESKNYGVGEGSVSRPKSPITRGDASDASQASSLVVEDFFGSSSPPTNTASPSPTSPSTTFTTSGMAWVTKHQKILFYK